MRIERAVLREVPLRLATPFESSAGLVAERRVLLLTLEGEGLQGWSECVAPNAPTYTYESTATAWHVLSEYILPDVPGTDLSEPGDVLRAAEALRGHPMAKATVEMAACDLVARAKGISLSAMLGGTRSTVEVGLSLGMMPVEGLIDAVTEHLTHGYRRVKVKIGPGRDVDVLNALRKRFPELTLWADANSAYAIQDADHLRELDPLGIDMLEEPLLPGHLTACAELQGRIRTPICLDESIGSEGDLAAALALGSCKVVNLKPGRVGGFAASLRIYEMLVEHQVPVWCGGMLETGIGRAHNLALASLSAFSLPGDLSASRRYWDRDIVTPEFEVREGRMTVPTGPGMGVAVDVDRIETLTDRLAEFV